VRGGRRFVHQEIVLTEAIVTICVPRLNANEDVVTLTRWLVTSGSRVSRGQVVAEIETSKASFEVEAADEGVIVPVVVAGSTVGVGAPMAYVGPDVAAIEAWLASQRAARDTGSRSEIAATAKAKALARSRDIDLAEVAAGISSQTIKEADVRRFIEAQGGHRSSVGKPSFNLGHSLYENAGLLSPHQQSVAASLRAAQARGIFTTLQFTFDLTASHAALASEIAHGHHVSLMGLLLLALAKVLPKFPLLTTVADGCNLHRHKDLDIAFVARSLDGRLFTPVVRNLDRLDLRAITVECTRLTKQVMKGKLAADDLYGGAFTISLIPVPGVDAFTALPPSGQAAILAVAAERQELVLEGDRVSARPVATATLTYDHTITDGLYAAQFLSDVNRILSHRPGHPCIS
jgi:pyruvate dehydrogenase E2 component (dihydrolipoamide acetyltransferase)